jgi:hypothetical protein
VFLAMANFGASKSVVRQKLKTRTTNAPGGLVNVYKPLKDIEDFIDVGMV